jgi:succinate dehydrogenase / fumarate reductase flavoprotein subunit
MPSARLLSCDVLVVGSGGAGVRAAIEAHAQGADVLVCTRSQLGQAHTINATGGVNAALGYTDPKDTWVTHAADTIKEGAHLNDPRLVELLAREARDRAKELMRWGCPFHQEHGRYVQRFFGAHTYRRTLFVGDRTGRAILETLVRQAKKRKLRVLDSLVLTSFLVKDGKCLGATFVDTRTGDFLIVRAKATIACTGGFTRVYRVNSHLEEAYGAGLAEAYRAGAELQDMEMVQFHPTGMVWPKKVEGKLVTEAVRGEGGRLYNSKGERFMERYYPERKELGPRDVVARANYREILAGRTGPHGGVWLDISHQPAAYIKKRLPQMVEQFRTLAGVDITKERMEVAPTAHYTMGGLRTKPLTGETTIKNLFAAGEVTGGVHGGNRLGGNSLADILVFGRRAGLAAARLAKRSVVPNSAHQFADLAAREYKRVHEPLARRAGVQPGALKERLRDLMWRHAGIFRTGPRLRAGLAKVLRVKKLAAHARARGLLGGRDWVEWNDLGDMLVCCEAILRGALARTESRGAHYREDFPRTRPAWKVNLVYSLGPGGMKLRRARVPPARGPVARALRRKVKGGYGLVE